MSKETRSLGQTLRNPLVVFGLVLLAGDGPLLIAYISSSDPTRQSVLLGCLVAFVFAMGAVFCYLVISKPRNLYSPQEIPEFAVGKPLYVDPKLEQSLRREEKEVEDRSVRKTDRLLAEIKEAVEKASGQKGVPPDARPDGLKALEDYIKNASAAVKEVQKEALEGRELVRAKEALSSRIASCHSGVSEADLMQYSESPWSFDKSVLQQALRSLISEGFIRMSAPGFYSVSPGVCRVADARWDGKQWLYRIEPSNRWVKEDSLMPFDGKK